MARKIADTQKLLCFLVFFLGGITIIHPCMVSLPSHARHCRLAVTSTTNTKFPPSSRGLGLLIWVVQIGATVLGLFRTRVLPGQHALTSKVEGGQNRDAE